MTQHGLSAYFGQAGVNWMSVHTGIDFPVSYGTPVMAATDGTVRTQWNSAYGNMAIVTAPDGTETWYCHLSSTKIRSGTGQGRRRHRVLRQLRQLHRPAPALRGTSRRRLGHRPAAVAAQPRPRPDVTVPGPSEPPGPGPVRSYAATSA